MIHSCVSSVASLLLVAGAAVDVPVAVVVVLVLVVATVAVADVLKVSVSFFADGEY